MNEVSGITEYYETVLEAVKAMVAAGYDEEQVNKTIIELQREITFAQPGFVERAQRMRSYVTQFSAKGTAPDSNMSQGM